MIVKDCGRRDVKVMRIWYVLLVAVFAFLIVSKDFETKAMRTEAQQFLRSSGVAFVTEMSDRRARIVMRHI